MRLINADKLENVDFSDCIDSMEIMNVIDEQPTAYDVDAVVEQLDTYITKLVGRNAALYQTVMRIVKGGGVDGNQTDFLQYGNGPGNFRWKQENV